MADPYRLSRFIQAQDPVFAEVLDELRAGLKRTHWMWFVFPQLRGLGASPMAYLYGISCLAEAQAFATHPLLGDRLRLCTNVVLEHADKPLTAIFGAPDDLKFRSSMTLFGQAVPEEQAFQDALAQLCAGSKDQRTLSLLKCG